MRRPGYILRLPHAALRARVPIAAILRPALGRKPSAACVAAFELTNDERRFVYALLRHPRFWLYRSNQRRFCGDFVVVDMSAAKPCRRSVWVIDLKRDGRLHLGGGGAGVQLTNRHLAVRELAGRGVAGTELTPQAVVGGREVVVQHILSPTVH